MNTHDIWEAVLAELELSISRPNFATWFKQTGIMSFQDGTVILCVPNDFHKAWLEKKYHQMIVASLERVTGKPIKKLNYRVFSLKNISPCVAEDGSKLAQTSSLATIESIIIPSVTHPQQSPLNSYGLNTKYTFSSYVVGSGSELAFAAAQAVVKRPGEAYNPLFIYGGVGLGKTHILQAIGNQILADRPNSNIMYASAEKFSNDFILSIKEGDAKNFQNRYRNIDVLLIDDIQFISGKDKTQESFFHTFNELHQQNKQVVMTSDRPPKAIPALEDRLKSRFEWGMIVDVSPPDLETRIAILQAKCSEKNFTLDPDVVRLVASIIQRNIRELEGGLNKIIAYHQLKNISPTIDSVKLLLMASAAQDSTRKSVTPQQIIDAACQYYEISNQDVLGKSREKRYSLPRQIIMFLLRHELNLSFPNIGDELGGRDHTTAMHADKKIEAVLENDIKIKQDVDLIKQKIYINHI